MVCTNFFSLRFVSAQALILTVVINSLWKGDLVQRNDEDLDVECESRVSGL